MKQSQQEEQGQEAEQKEEDKMMNRKGAIELSMTTVVIIVLAMTMLILGLVLVRTIFTGATYNVQSINDKVRGEINKLFTEEAQKIVVYLPAEGAAIKQSESYGVVFAVKNIEMTPQTFNYKVSVSEMGGCPSTTNPMTWISLGKAGTFNAASGDTNPIIVKFIPAATAPLCSVRFNIDVTEGTATYASTSFDVQITSK
jgi:hypothetical protein